MPPAPLLNLEIRHDPDVVTARKAANQLAGMLGFDGTEQTRIATAVSEVVRNAFRYAGGGTVGFALEGATAPQVLEVRVVDHGPGIPHLEEVLSGRYGSTSGMGMGIVGARRLMDAFDIQTVPGQGTMVVMRKLLPRRAPFLTPARCAQIAADLSRRPEANLTEELHRQNRELLGALEELTRRQEDLANLNRELEDTNRGVVALYAELDEKADHLRRADELKSKFLSNMTHEFRTPVNSILALTGLLLERGSTAPELQFIRKAAEQLSELVNDLLDLAKVEAGKTVVRPSEFDVSGLFGALRGMLRPLLVNQSVAFVVEDPAGLPLLYSDEGKVSQILRNFLSNALKFTETGRIVLSARFDREREEIVFTVSDTGIGIAREDQPRIFEEFGQLEHPIQRRVRGTGLGLPLSRRLATLLGGRIWVESEVGRGSTFFLALPLRYPVRGGPRVAAAQADRSEPGRIPVLVIEDSLEDQLFYERVLRATVYQRHPARTLQEARQVLADLTPAAIVLDIVVDHEHCWDFLTSLKRDPRFRDIPVLVVSSVDDARKGLALGADLYAVKPITPGWLTASLDSLIARARGAARLLMIEDQEATRYVLRQLLTNSRYAVEEAHTGAEGLRRAIEHRPDFVLLDLGLPDMNGREVLRQLRSDPRLSDVPVVVVTSERLEATERAALLQTAHGMLRKDELTRRALEQVLHEAAERAGDGLSHGHG